MDPLLEGTTDAGVAGRSRSLEKRLPVNAGTFGNFATRALGEKSSPLAVLCPLDVERVDVRGISFSDRSFGTTAPPRSEMVFRFSSPCFISLILATSKSITRSNTPSSTTNVRPLKPPLPVLVVLFVGTGTSNILEGPVVGTGLRTAGPTLFDLAPPRLE